MVGSSPAESNHSSYCARIGRVSIVEPAAAVQQCIQHQIDISKEYSADLSRYHLTSRAKASLLKGSSDVPNKAALLALSSWGFELWEQVSSQSHFYSTEVSEEEHDGEKVFLVFRNRSQSSSPRTVTKSGSKRCNCEYRVAYNIQCPHETCVSDGNFMPNSWAPQWLQRHQVSSSNNTGEFVQFQPDSSFASLLPPSDLLFHNGDDHLVQFPDEPEPLTLPTPSSPIMMQGSQDEGGDWQFTCSPDAMFSSPPMPLPGSQAMDLSRTTAVNHKDWTQQCHDLMSAGQKLPRDQQQLCLGLVIMLVDMFNNSTLNEQSAINAYQVYSSRFGRNQSNLFSQEYQALPPSTTMGMIIAHPQRGSHNSSLQSQRLQSNVEKAKKKVMRSRKARDSTCSFCNDISGHKNIKSCPKYLQLTSTGVLVRNNSRSAALDQFAVNLGNPACHLVEVPSNALIVEVLNDIDDLSSNVVPKGAYHVVIKRVYYSTPYLEWCNSKRPSRHSNPTTTDSPPNMGHNVAEVLFMDMYAQDLEVQLKETFLLCVTLSKWILQVGSRGQRRVFSELKDPPEIGVNNYSREAFVSM